MGAWDRGSPRGWRQRRSEVLQRDGYRCRIQDEGCTGKATQVHHTIGASVTGIVTDSALLLSACASCNRQAGQPNSTNLEYKAMTVW